MALEILLHFSLMSRQVFRGYPS